MIGDDIIEREDEEGVEWYERRWEDRWWFIRGEDEDGGGMIGEEGRWWDGYYIYIN